MEFRTQQHRENLDSKNYNLNPATKEANRNLATINYHTERRGISNIESQQDSSPFSKTQNDNKLDSNPTQNTEKTESANKANHA